MDATPDNIIDLMPYIEGAKFGWTVDMTHAVLRHGTDVTNKCLAPRGERIKFVPDGRVPYDPTKL